MSAEAHRYAVFGHPIAHSLSPEIHQAFASQLGIHLRYETIDVPPGEFAGAVTRFFAEGGLGANVTLPHKEAAFVLATERSEAARRLGKGIEGCGYFISQTVYHAQPTQRLLADYLRDCRGAGTAPKRVVLTFAPCGREKTLAFLRWLGVNVSAETERSILGAANPLAKSIEVCRDNLRRILDVGYASHISLGINVESVTINRDEIDASVHLFHSLKEVLQGR